MIKFFASAALALATLTGCTTIPQLGSRFDGPPPANRRLVIDLSSQQASLVDGDRVRAVSPISSGSEGRDTPPGTYSVIEKDIDHRSSVYGNYVRDGKIVKGGVDNRRDPQPAGTTYLGAPMPYFLRFTRGYGLHAGYLPGYPASHGCVRMPLAQAKRFYQAVELGTPVVVKR